MSDDTWAVCIFIILVLYFFAAYVKFYVADLMPSMSALRIRISAAIDQWKATRYYKQQVEQERIEEIARLLGDLTCLNVDPEPTTSSGVSNWGSSSASLKSVSSPSEVSDEGFLDDVEDMMKMELFLNKRPPPPGYVCEICWTGGHYKNMCPKLSNRVSGVTPYQGNKRCIGEFTCSKCKRKWSSFKSWANFAQKCIKCNIQVYPKKQRPLTEESTNVTKHPRYLCEKCGHLGDIKCCQYCDGKNKLLPSIRKNIHFPKKYDKPAKKRTSEWKSYNGPVRKFHKNHDSEYENNFGLKFNPKPNAYYSYNDKNTEEFVMTDYFKALSLM